MLKTPQVETGHTHAVPYIASAGIKPPWPSDWLVREKVIFTELTTPVDSGGPRDQQVNCSQVCQHVCVCARGMRACSVCSCDVFLFKENPWSWSDWRGSWSETCPRSVMWPQSTMDHEMRLGLSVWAIVAIVCNSVVGVLVLILFVILYKACKVPSHPEKVPVLTAEPQQKKAEQKYLLTAAWWRRHWLEV